MESQASAERSLRTESPAAFCRAIEAALLERPREQVPLDWAAHNNLGAVLRMLGERGASGGGNGCLQCVPTDFRDRLACGMGGASALTA